jgi:hypothetical protein
MASTTFPNTQHAEYMHIVRAALGDSTASRHEKALRVYKSGELVAATPKYETLLSTECTMVPE